MLSDHEQRVLAELERCFETDVGEPARSVPAGSVPASRGHARLTSRRPGTWPTIVQGFVSVALLITGVPAAALALATATAIGWLFWRLWSLRRNGERPAASVILGAGHGHGRSGRRLGESVRQYLRWLSVAE